LELFRHLKQTGFIYLFICLPFPVVLDFQQQTAEQRLDTPRKQHGNGAQQYGVCAKILLQIIHSQIRLFIKSLYQRQIITLYSLYNFILAF